MAGGCGAPLVTILPEPAVPGVPTSDEEMVIAAAIRHAVVDARDIPSYSDLRDKTTLVVVSDCYLGEDQQPLTAAALPQTSEVCFHLFTWGEVLYWLNFYHELDCLCIEHPTISGDSATVEAHLVLGAWIEPWLDATTSVEGHPALRYAPGYILQFQKQADVWRFVGTGDFTFYNRD
jgi:hypothetical protein